MSNYHPVFTLSRPAERVRFGAGCIGHLTEEAGRLGCRRALLVTTPGGARFRAGVEAALGPLLADSFHGAQPHAPEEVTAQLLDIARSAGADLILSVGGGTAVGAGKVLADAHGVPHIAVPTTYSGVEAVPAIETTRGGATRSQASEAVLPECVIYDSDLTLCLSWEDSLATGTTALAHAVGGLFARDRTPVSRLLAKEALWAIAGALPLLRDEPGHAGARGEMLYAAWATGCVRGAVARSVQHRLVDGLCRIGGVPASRLHGVLLPHTVAFAEGATGGLLDPLRSIFGSPPSRGIQDFTAELGVPVSLAALGLGEGDLDRVADLAATGPPHSQRPATRQALRAILGAAWAGPHEGRMAEPSRRAVASMG